MSLDTHNAFGYKYIAVSLLCVSTIHCSSFIAKCQYNTLQLHCQVLIQYSAASLPSVNTIHCSFIAKCQYNTLQLHCQVSIQYIAASLLSVNTIHYGFIAKCQYNCARKVLWCQAHSLHIHASHKTSFNWNNSKHRGKRHWQNNKKTKKSNCYIKLRMSHQNFPFTRSTS